MKALEKKVTQKISLLEDGLSEGDGEVTEEFMHQHYTWKGKIYDI